MRKPLHIAAGLLLGAVVGVAVLMAIEAALALSGKKEPPFINPGHAPVHDGARGPALCYVVIGDSTSAGRGAPYENGIAISTMDHLAQKYRVTMTNFSVSGAVAADLVRNQLSDAAVLKPDLVLISAGANDATHFTSSSSLHEQLMEIVRTLRTANPDVRIVVTGCPQMGSIPRFLQPLRWFAGTQTDRINAVFSDVVQEDHIVWAHIADRTGPAFQKDPTLFADDKFHPNARGYAIWIPVLNEALDRALLKS